MLCVSCTKRPPPCADYVRFGSNFKDISNDCFEITRLKQLRHKVILKVICGCKQYDTFFVGDTSTLTMPDKSASPRRIDILNSRISRGLPHTTYFYVAIRVEQSYHLVHFCQYHPLVHMLFACRYYKYFGY